MRAGTVQPARGAAPAPAAVRPLSGALGLLLALSILLLFTVSGSALWDLGYNYDGIAGNAPTKIHPGTYLVALVFVLAALSNGDPVRWVIEAASRSPGGLVLAAAAALALAQTGWRSAPGMAGFVDSYMLPAFAAALVGMADRTTRDRIEAAVHAAMVSNAALALFEFATRSPLFPYRFDGEVYPNDVRSTALGGHPLINATLTAVYILALLNGGGRVPAPLRAGVVLLEGLALVAFGGRAATVTCALLAGVTGLVALVRVVRSGRVPLLGAALVTLLATLTPVALVALAAGGFFDPLLERFASDNGSAATRIEMLELLRRIPSSDLVLGPDPGWVDSLRRTSGLALGIENPVVKTLLYQGAAVTGLLIAALAWFFRDVARAAGRGVAMPLVAFLVVINTFESLGSKSTLLARFAVMILILFRHGRAASGRAAVRKPAGAGVPVPRSPARRCAPGRSSP